MTEQVPAARSVSVGIWVRAGSVTRRPTRWASATSSSTWCSRAPAAGRRGTSPWRWSGWGVPGRVHDARAHQLTRRGSLTERRWTGARRARRHGAAPQLAEADLELEREVVLEEISTVEDTPDDLVFDLHAAALWGGPPVRLRHPGHPAIGGGDDGRRSSRPVHGRAYDAPNLLVAAAGPSSTRSSWRGCGALFEGAPAGGRAVPCRRRRRDAPRRTGGSSGPPRRRHIVPGRRTFAHGDPRRYALVLLSNAFGGGMSSRLFQRVREELGLAYAVYAFQSFYRSGGHVRRVRGHPAGVGGSGGEVIREELAAGRRGAGRRGAGGREGPGQGADGAGAGVAAGRGCTGWRCRSSTTSRIVRLDELMARVDAVTMEEGCGLRCGATWTRSGMVRSRLGPADLNHERAGSHDHRRTEGDQDEREPGGARAGRRGGAGARRAYGAGGAWAPGRVAGSPTRHTRPPARASSTRPMRSGNARK